MKHTSPKPDDWSRARFVPLVCYSHVDGDDANGRPLNRYPHVLCDACRLPDLSRPPSPFFISKPPAKSSEMMLASEVIVVRPRVLGILKSVAGDQISVGEVRVKGKKASSGADKLHWVMPKRRIGSILGKALTNPCPKCKRPLESRVADPGRDMECARVEHFGDGAADIAVTDGYYGAIRNGVFGGHLDFALSGALFAHLKNSGVKGIATSPGGEAARCYVSAKDEPTFEPVPRTLGDSGAAPEKRGSAELVASLKDVPWDHTTDGYVYLHLSTPQIIAIDPMTFEEDAGGPYVLKKFKAGLHRFPVSAIRTSKSSRRGVAVDSGTLLFIDGALYADLQEKFEWDKSNARTGALSRKYLDQVAKQVGTRFGICSASGNAKHDFQGDGDYVLDTKAVKRVRRFTCGTRS